MPKAPDDNGGAAVREAEPGAAMRMVAGKLAAHGYDLRDPDWPESRRLTVTGLPGTTCDVLVDDDGGVMWEYWRRPSVGADPDRLAGLVTDLGIGLLHSRSA